LRFLLQEKEDTTSKSDSTGLPAFIPETEKNSPGQLVARRGERPILAGAIILIFDAFLFEFFTGSLPILIPSLILGIGVAVAIGGAAYRNAVLKESPRRHEIGS
jgi:hypothetical protein